MPITFSEMVTVARRGGGYRYTRTLPLASQRFEVDAFYTSIYAHTHLNILHTFVHASPIATHHPCTRTRTFTCMLHAHARAQPLRCPDEPELKWATIDIPELRKLLRLVYTEQVRAAHAKLYRMETLIPK